MIKTKNSLDEIRREMNFREMDGDACNSKNIFDNNKILCYAADYLDILIRQIEQNNEQ